MKAFDIIDSHCHIFPQKIAQKAADSTNKFYGIKDTSPFDGTAESLLKQCKTSGVKRCVINSVATTPRQVSDINKFIAGEVLKHPDEFIGLGTLHPNSKNLKEDFDEILALGLKGVKLHPDIQGFKVDDYRCLKIYELCETAGLPILLHTGDKRFDNSNPNRVLPVFGIYDRLTVIGAHLGGWSVWEKASENLSELPTFFVDTSSSFYSLNKDDALKIIRRYGADKVVFGTDYPMWTQKDEIEYMLNLGLTDEELEKIFCTNILKLLKI